MVTRSSCDDDYFFLNEENKFEYFIIERSNYAVFKEYHNNDFFTTHVIDFLRTLESNGKIIVQEDDGSGKTDDEDILFTGKIILHTCRRMIFYTEFLTHPFQFVVSIVKELNFTN